MAQLPTGLFLLASASFSSCALAACCSTSSSRPKEASIANHVFATGDIAIAATWQRSIRRCTVIRYRFQRVVKGVGDGINTGRRDPERDLQTSPFNGGRR